MHLLQILMVTSELIVCGSSEVFIMELRDDAAPKQVWSWRGPDKRFAYTAECKPVDGGRRILIASSTDGVALVERATGRVEFDTSVTNAHSAELLPGNRIAVAASHRGKTGDRLIVFDLASPKKPAYETPLPSGHGVVWDADRKLVWALSGRDLRTYKLAENGLTPLQQYPLPDGGGHDLCAVPGSSRLSVSTTSACWLFERDRLAFIRHPLLGNAAEVKSIDVHPETGQLVYVQADPGVWWSDRLRFAAPQQPIRFEGQKLYKARWTRRP